MLKIIFLIISLYSAFNKDIWLQINILIQKLVQFFYFYVVNIPDQEYYQRDNYRCNQHKCMMV